MQRKEEEEKKVIWSAGFSLAVALANQRTSHTQDFDKLFIGKTKSMNLCYFISVCKRDIFKWNGKL